jgi:aldehyde dehydrogenase (NAD+)
MQSVSASRSKDALESIERRFGLPGTLTSVVGGHWLRPGVGEIIAVEDPGTGLAIAAIEEGGAEAVDRAVTAADRAFRDGWRALDGAARGRILLRLAAAIRANAAELATLETLDTGKPLSQARGDVELGARYFEYYGGAADKVGGETLPYDEHQFAYTVREPYGVVAHITPWNSPITQLSRGVAPSLAVGNTVVVKPSELAPMSSLVLGRLLTEAGLPEGVLNVVPGAGRTGAMLAGHPTVRHISFTGSVPTGRKVLGTAAERIVPCNLELGGKSPSIILPDADLRQAARAGAMAVVRNSGQSCFATTRLLVHRDIHDALVAAVADLLAGLSVGHGLDDPDLGPIVSAAQLAKAASYIAAAQDEGAHIAHVSADLPDPRDGGYFMAPTLLVDVRNSMRVAREEIFGPVQSVIVFDDLDEAAAIANETEYGLAAGIFTQNLRLAHQLASRLEAGQILINRYPAGGVETPFGGYKQSGIGREKGLQALHAYTQLKSVVVSYN